MRHQIKFLITAIIIFAAFATSALKADDIEGTWSQDGQYKRFSKEYKDIVYYNVSADTKKLAIVSDNVLKVIQIESGVVLDTLSLLIPGKTIIGIPTTYAISKDFRYFAFQYNLEKTNTNPYVFQQQLLIFNLQNDSIIVDSTCIFSFPQSSTANYSASGAKALFINNTIYYSQFNYSYTQFADGGYGSFSKAFNCETKKEITNNVPVSIDSYCQSNNSALSIAYRYYYYSNKYGANYYETICKFTSDSFSLISDRYWSQQPYQASPESAYKFIGLTSDDKNAIVLNDNNQMVSFDLITNTARQVTQANGNTKFPEFASSTILFPIDKAGKSILLLKSHGNNLLINNLHYETGVITSIASADNDYITNTKAKYMIDSNKILSITEAGELYLLDLEAIQPDKGIDISTDKQFCTTNDSVSFVVINPNSYTDISIDFGDGSSVSSEKAKHKYSEMGKYSITVKAKDQYSNEVILRKEKYITVNQGIEIKIIPTINYESNRKITIKAKVEMSGNYSDLNLYIKPANDVSQQIQTIEEDTIIGEFTGLGYYTIRVTCFDNQFNKFISKDTVLNVFGPSDSSIFSENYTNTNVSSNVHLFKYSKGFQAFYHFYTSSYATSIDSNFQIKNQEYYKGSAYYWSFAQLSDANYYLSMSTSQGGRFSIYDNRKSDPMDSLLWYYNTSGFGFNDDTLATIDKETNEIVLRLFKDITEIKRINTYVQFNSQPLVCHDTKNKKVFLIDNSTESGITLYGVNQNYQLKKIRTIVGVYQPDYIIAQTLKSNQNNVFEFIDTNGIVALNFNTGLLQKYSIPNFNIQQVVHISDTTIALLGIDSDSVINVCLVDSNYIEQQRITLPYRTGNVLFAEKNKQNQLDFALRTPIGNLYFCTVKISDDTSAIVESPEIGKLLDSDLLCFPNPAANKITIDYPLSTSASIIIADAKGKTIKPNIISMNDSDFSIDTSLLPDGMYFVQIRDGEINKNIKFIVKR